MIDPHQVTAEGREIVITAVREGTIWLSHPEGEEWRASRRTAHGWGWVTSILQKVNRHSIEWEVHTRPIDGHPWGTHDDFESALREAAEFDPPAD